MNRNVRRAAGAGIALAMLALPACTPATEPAPGASTASASDATATTAPSESEAPSGSTSAGYSTYGIHLGPVAGDGPNERTTLIAGDLEHLLNYEGFADVNERWTKDEVTAAHEVATKFLVENMLDSGYMWTEDREEALTWLDTFEEYPGSGFKADSAEWIADPEKQQWFAENLTHWRPPADPERAPANGTEYSDVTISSRGMKPWSDPELGEFIDFGFEAFTVTPIRHPDKSNSGAYDHHSKWHVSLYVGDDAGTWKIAGVRSQRWSDGFEAGQEPVFPKEK